MRHLVIITDCVDIAYQEIRAQFFSFLGEKSKDIQIEPVVSVQPLSVLNGSFSLRLLAEVYPPKTIFYVVLNPVAHQPERIFGITGEKDMVFVGRNTGVFGWLAKDLGCKELYELPFQEYRAFGGKYVYPELISRIISGVPLDQSGEKRDPAIINSIDMPDGTIVHIDNFGICKIKGRTTLFADMGLETGSKVQVFRNGKPLMLATYQPRIMAGTDGEWVCCHGSSLGGLPELCKVRRNGIAEYNLAIGDMIEFKKA